MVRSLAVFSASKFLCCYFLQMTQYQTVRYYHAPLSPLNEARLSEFCQCDFGNELLQCLVLTLVFSILHVHVYVTMHVSFHFTTWMVTMFDT